MFLNLNDIQECTSFSDDIPALIGNQTVANFHTPRVWFIVFADDHTCSETNLLEADPGTLNFVYYDIQLLNPDALGNPTEHFSDEETGWLIISLDLCHYIGF